MRKTLWKEYAEYERTLEHKLRQEHSEKEPDEGTLHGDAIVGGKRICQSETLVLFKYKYT